MRLIASFEVELPAPFIVKRRFEEEAFSHCFRVEEADVRLILLSDEWGAKSKDVDEEYWSFPISRVRVEVARTVESEPPEPIRKDGKTDYSPVSPYFEKLRPTYQRVAVDAVNRAIAFFQFRLCNPGLRRISMRHPDVQNPEWTSDAGERFTTGFTAVVGKMPGLRFDELGSSKLTPELDSVFREALEDRVEPDLWEELRSGAQEAAFDGNVRRAVLELAVACEVFLKGRFFGGSSTAESVFEYLEDKGWVRVRTVDLLHGVAAHAFGASFKDDNPADYQNIDHLFRARNKVAHRGQPEYRDDGGQWHEVSGSTLRDWWESVEHMVSWVEER